MPGKREEAMSDAIWYYGKDGRENVYEADGHIYLKGKVLYTVRGGNWHEPGSGKRLFRRVGKWMRTAAGENAYWTN